MPELAEVERAKNDCKRTTEGKVISEVLTKEDTKVFQGCTHDEFAKSLKGKTISKVGRLGKYFYLVMQGAPHVILHLGMAGFVSTRGQEPLFYRKKAKNWKNDDGSDWPLRYWKFALKMDDGSEWCFSDSRRFGRISLVHSGEKDVTEVEPLSLLGRDPYLDMPSLDLFSQQVSKRKAPIKAVLLDQNGPLCGLGNWLVDEILFQSKMHPAQRADTLTTSQLLTLHTEIQTVVNTAVSVNADHAQFPKTWLFKYRWGKGRRNEPATFTLPDGTLATVIHQTVGGRTTAIVEAVQKLIGEAASDAEEEGAASKDEDDEEDDVKKEKTQIKAVRKKRTKMTTAKEAVEEAVESILPKKRAPRKTAKKAIVKKEEDEENDAAEEDSVSKSLVRPATKPQQQQKKEEEITTKDEKPLKAVKGTVTRKRAAVPSSSGGRKKVKIEAVVEPVPALLRAQRASSRLQRASE